MRLALVAHIEVLVLAAGGVAAVAKMTTAEPAPTAAAAAAASMAAPTTTATRTPPPVPEPTWEPTSIPMHVEPADHVSVGSAAALPDVDLADFQNRMLPGSIPDDRGLTLGSIGSGLFGVGEDEYWTITDRGPNGEPSDFVRSFPVPGFNPALVKVRMRGDSVEIVKALPLMTAQGDPVTGLPPFVRPGDPRPAMTDGSTPADLLNPNGIDPEGVVATAKGFWIVDEYGPSILSVSLTGEVLTRYVPAGAEPQFEGSDIRIVGSLPADLAGRAANRGFEDVALLADGKSLVVGLQSPLAGQTDTLVTKLGVFDIESKKMARMYDYVFDAPRTFWKEPGERAKPKHLKISALLALDRDRVLVQERTDMESRFYEVTLADDPVLSGSDKRMIVNLAGVPGVPNKIEGVAVKDADTLVISSDNDFGFNTEGRVPAAGDIPRNSVKPTFVEVKLR